MLTNNRKYQALDMNKIRKKAKKVERDPSNWKECTRRN
jgi:hypothetical protein